jgi:integrase
LNRCFKELKLAKRRAKGEGSIYFNKGLGLWIAQITLPTGKRTSKSDKTQKVVMDWLIEQRNKANEGLYVTDDRIKLGEFLDRFLGDVAVHYLRPRTFESHNGYVQNHIKPELGNIRLNQLRPDQVQAFYTKKLSEGLSKRTVQYMHAILHKALDQAFRWGLVTRNVTDLVDAPRPKRKPLVVWNAEQVKTFLQAVEDHQYYPLYLLAIYTGMRQGEILGVHKEDIDLANGIINVQHQVQPIRGKGLVVTDVKTDKSKRPVTLPETVLNVIRELLKAVESGLIFTSRSGQPYWSANVYRHFKQTITELGLPNIRFHDLRHTHATLLLAAGVHPKVVQERLGHSQISLTLDTYSHVIPSLQTEAAEQFEAILS